MSFRKFLVITTTNKDDKSQLNRHQLSMWRGIRAPLKQVWRGYSTGSATEQVVKTPKVQKHGFTQPSETIPDVETFLNKIGRNSIEHLEKFPRWTSLFTKSSQSMKSEGISVQDRKYILRQVETFRKTGTVRPTKKGKKNKYGGEYKEKEKKGLERAQKRIELQEKAEKIMQERAAAGRSTPVYN